MSSAHKVRCDTVYKIYLKGCEVQMEVFSRNWVIWESDCSLRMHSYSILSQATLSYSKLPGVPDRSEKVLRPTHLQRGQKGKARLILYE